MLVAGTMLFSAVVAEPVWRQAEGRDWPSVQPCRKLIAQLAGGALTLALASGIVHLVVIAAAVSEESWTEVLRDGTAWAFFTDTQFGALAQLRLVLATMIAALLWWSICFRGAVQDWVRGLAVILGVVFLGSLTWTGHAAGASGVGANTHLGADLVHLLAAGAWIGGLLPLALLVRFTSQSINKQSLYVCGHILHRFSRVGLVSVAALVVTGLVNTWYLTDRMSAFFGTEYGTLVQIKIGLFLAMLCLAGFNRVWLTPAIAGGHGGEARPHAEKALRQLRLTMAVEIALGLAVIYMVGLLGMTPPAGHHHE
jgi:copper resistance protein D